MEILNHFSPFQSINKTYLNEAKQGTFLSWRRTLIIKDETGRYAAIRANWFERMTQMIGLLLGNDYFSNLLEGRKITVLSNEDIAAAEKKFSIPSPKLPTEPAQPKAAPPPVVAEVIKPKPEPELSTPVTPSEKPPQPSRPAQNPVLTREFWEQEYDKAIKQRQYTNFLETAARLVKKFPNQRTPIETHLLEVIFKRVSLLEYQDLFLATFLVDNDAWYLETIRYDIEDHLFDRYGICAVETGEWKNPSRAFYPIKALEVLAQLKSSAEIHRYIVYYKDVKTGAQNPCDPVKPLAGLNQDKDLFYDLAREYSIFDINKEESLLREGFANYLTGHIVAADSQTVQELIKYEQSQDKRELLFLLTKACWQVPQHPLSDIVFCIKALLASNFKGEEKDFSPVVHSLPMSVLRLAREKLMFTEMLANEKLVEALSQDREGRTCLGYLRKHTQ